MSLRPLAAALLLAPLACTLRPYDPQASATATTDATTSTTSPAPATSTTLEPTTTSSTSTSSANTASTSSPPDLGAIDCDIWTDDCPEGQKCMPYASGNHGEWYDIARCVPLVPDPDHLGEPCTVLGNGIDGLDTCGRREICWNATQETKMGTCLAMCSGSQRMHFCEPPKTSCYVFAEGKLILCLPNCEPLLQDCPNQDLCIPQPGAPERFVCVLDASGLEGQALDPCDAPNACDPGLLCLDPALAVECDLEAAGCCLPLCDLTQPNTCPGKAQQCLPYHDPPLPGYENLGLCGLPPP